MYDHHLGRVHLRLSQRRSCTSPAAPRRRDLPHPQPPTAPPLVGPGRGDRDGRVGSGTVDGGGERTLPGGKRTQKGDGEISLRHDTWEGDSGDDGGRDTAHEHRAYHAAAVGRASGEGEAHTRVDARSRARSPTTALHVAASAQRLRTALRHGTSDVLTV